MCPDVHAQLGGAYMYSRIQWLRVVASPVRTNAAVPIDIDICVEQHAKCVDPVFC